jgi:hypothetical protein
MRDRTKQPDYSCCPCMTRAPWSIAQHSLNASMPHAPTRDFDSFRPSWLPRSRVLADGLHKANPAPVNKAVAIVTRRVSAKAPMANSTRERSR